jgi:excisionase family DNA binding protein
MIRRGNSMSPAETVPRLLRPREAATLLAVSIRKLWQLTNMRLIPSVRIGRSVRYDLRDLEAWIEQQKDRGNLRTWARQR